MSHRRVRDGKHSFEVIVCIAGRGFTVGREDMRRVLANTGGKDFTLQTLDSLIPHSSLRAFLPREASDS